MRLCIFRLRSVVIIGLLLTVSSNICRGTVSDIVPDTLNNRVDDDYLRRVSNYRNFWDKMILRYTKVQFAGGIGLFSIGWGWDYGKNRQWETDMLLGYVPKYSAKHGMITFTLKQNYIPWSIPFDNSSISFEPLTCGLYLNSALNGKFWTKEPSRYPRGYYGFSTKLRPFIFIGEKLTYYMKPGIRHKQHKSISFYYELGTCDVYLVTAVKNSSIKLHDIIKLSFGLKFQIL